MCLTTHTHCASGSVGGARPCQGRGRGFESRLALIFLQKDRQNNLPVFFAYQEISLIHWNFLVSKKRSARIALWRSRKCCYSNPPQAENVAIDILYSLPGNFVEIVLVSKKRSARIALRRSRKCCYSNPPQAETVSIDILYSFIL